MDNEAMKTNYEQTMDLDDPGIISALDEAPLWSVPFGEMLLEKVVFGSDLAVLDVGCGLGFPLLELAQRLGSTARLIGIDPWQAALRRCEAKRHTYGLENVGIVPGVAEAMPFRDCTFDLIISNNGLNNVDNRISALRECHRVARFGAQLVFTENLPGTMVEFYQCYEQVLEETGYADRIPLLHRQIAEKRMPPEETWALLEATKFEVVSAETRSFEMRFLDGTTMLNHFLIRAAFLPGFRSILTAEERDDVFRVLTERLDAEANESGALVLTIPFICFDCRKTVRRQPGWESAMENLAASPGE